MGLKLFITGVSGYLGGVIAARLAEMPEVDAITGIDISSEPLVPQPPKVRLVKMDVRSPDVAEAMAGHDYVIHTAFIVSWPASMPAAVRDDININGSRNVAQAAILNRVRGMLLTSSTAVYDPDRQEGRENASEEFPLGKGNSAMYYLNSKAITEKMLVEMLEPAGIPVTLFRICYVIGPMNAITIPMFRSTAVRFRDQDPLIQFVHEDDVAEAFKQAVRVRMPGAYNLVSDGAIHLSEFHRMIGVTPRTVPMWLARLVTFIRWKYLGSLMHPSWVRSAAGSFCASNAKLKATGWTPRYSGAEAVRSALAGEEQKNL